MVLSLGLGCKDDVRGTVSSQQTLFIIDDHERLRLQLSRFLAAEPELLVIGTAASAEETLSSLPETWPDLFLVDVSLPGMNGLELIHKLLELNSESKCLVLTGNSETIYKGLAKAKGAVGLIEKSDIDHLREAIQTILDGNEYW